jgi:hypothetical protein
MLYLLLLFLLAYTNSRLATKKGLNPLLWGFMSVIAFFLAYGVLGTIYLSLVYDGAYTREAIMAWIEKSPLSVAMLFMLGYGGMLLVRFIIERKQAEE